MSHAPRAPPCRTSFTLHNRSAAARRHRDGIHDGNDYRPGPFAMSSVFCMLVPHRASIRPTRRSRFTIDIRRSNLIRFRKAGDGPLQPLKL